MSRGHQAVDAGSQATAKKAAEAVAASVLALLMVGCARPVCAPAPARPDFQKAVVMRCIGGDQLVDSYLSSFQTVSTSERIEFMVALTLAPCPPEVTAWLEKRQSKE